jgi:hypothetical protein
VIVFLKGLGLGVIVFQNESRKKKMGREGVKLFDDEKSFY